MADKLTGDELIAYGFRRVVEELQELRGAMSSLNTSVEALAYYANRAGDNAKEAADVTRRLYDTLSKVEHNTFMINDGVMAAVTDLDAVKTNTFTAELNCIRMSQELRKGNTEDETKRMGGV